MPSPSPEFPPDAQVQQPLTFAQAVAGMVDRPFLASQNWQEQQHRADRSGAHPHVLEFERLFVKRMAKMGIPVFASEVLRTAERQNDLFALGTTRAKGGQSAHQFGCAVDLVHSVKGWQLSPLEWAVMEHVGRELAKARGLAVHNLHGPDGQWSFYDPAHWQVVGWKAVRDDYPEWRAFTLNKAMANRDLP